MNTPPPGPPTGTDRRPTGEEPRSCRQRCRRLARRSGRTERAARSEKAPGWRRFSGPRTGDWPPGQPWSRPPRGATGIEKDWTMGEPDGADRAKALPWSAHALLFPAAGVACGGAARGGPGVGPHSQPIPSESQAGQVGAPLGRNGSKRVSKRGCPKKSSVFYEAVAVRFWLRDGYLPVGTGVFGFPVRRVASPAEASELWAGRVPRFRFQQPSLSGAIECSHRIESGALPTASPSTFLDHGQQPMQSPSPREGARTCLAAL